MTTNPRLVYRVILKILTALAVLVLLWVFTKSLFVDTERLITTSKKPPIVVLDISAMKKGEIKKTRWDGKEIAVLFRKEASPEQTTYFVYENHGDSGHCPLFYANNTLKDVCTGKVFNAFGQEIDNPEQGYKLIVPPYYIEEKKVFFGSKHK